MTDENPSCVVLLSGGINSTVCAFLAKEKYNSVHCLFINYGQRNAKKEEVCALSVAKRIGATFKAVDLSWYARMNQSSSLLNNTVPVPKEVIKGEIPSSNVPFMNGIMLTIAAAYSDTMDLDAIYIGVSGDSEENPDHRPEFFWAMQNALYNGSSGSHPTLEIPLQDMLKDEIVALGKNKKIPFESTWTCYANDKDPCNQCIGCISRKGAFKLNRLEDPLYSN